MSISHIPEVSAPPRQYIPQQPPTLYTGSSRMATTTPIETEYNLFYEPDVYNPPGSCVNDFKDIPDLIQYIEEQIEDVYLECNEFQDTHVAKDGQILDIATITIRNAHNEEMDVKLFDRHLFPL